ncbi:hypothetical protein [Micromonospora humi]|uniref:Uncharacterized protein n=1 Tax=Micromonospora humi TaxID=745366 RepID=A0A1C5HTQ9_9ACTN|nr:hypothetical protein [Micromonospora humi]SCG49352.1 hypothetical protein GA0070213_1044 [Micromonospora humi]
MTATLLAPTRHRSRTAPLAAGWLAFWGVLALISTVTGAGYPFGDHDRDRPVNLLRLVPVSLGPALFAALLLTAAVVALAMAGPVTHPSRPLRALLLGYGWTVAFVLAVVVPDTRVLITLGYAPILLVGAPFGWPPVDYADVFTWTLLCKTAAMAGGVLLALAVLGWQRRTAGACAACGRGAAERDWTTADAAARWGRWAAWTAAVIPTLYALTRLAWAAGIPLGISRDFLDEMHDSGIVWAGAGLGAFAVAGAVLTLGLVRPWGERFPRWMVGLAGRRVPVSLAVVPATLVALAVTAGSLGLVTAPRFWELTGGFSLTTLPMLLWPLWGVALGAATYAYLLRRRGVCRRCGR